MKEDEIISAPSLWELTRTFLHLGGTAYGGLAMVEPIRRRVVQEQGWLSQQDFLDGLALCQLVPGATVVQLATYVGYRLRRTDGGPGRGRRLYPPRLCAYAGPLCPLLRVWRAHLGQSGSRGFNAVVIALLLQALWRL